MGALEIILLAAGAVIFIASFCVPIKQEKLKEETKTLAAEEVKTLVAGEVESVRGKLTEISEEEMQQQIEKSERSMERISNEKIMAVNEYSDTVLEEIHKSHEEVVFLYDMLKNRKESLSQSYDKADQNLQELLQQVKDSEITVQENLKEISGKLKEFEEKQTELEAASEAASKQIEAASRAAEQIEAASRAAEQIEAAPRASAKRKPAAPGRKTTGKSPENPDAAVKPAAESVPAEKNVPVAEVTAKEEPNDAAVFQPFTPEKIKAVPKKKTVSKAAEKQAEPPAPAPAAGNADVMLLLSDTVENSTVQNSNERILGLHKAGKSNMAIARELGLGVGEVKLVIDLYEGLR